MAGSEFRSYVERELEKFNHWLSMVEEAVTNVYVVSGDYFWKKEIGDRLSKSIGRRPDNVGEGLKKYTDRMRYKSMSGKKHFIWFEAKGSKLRADDFQTIKEYLNKPSKHGVLVLSLKDWDEKRSFFKYFKMIRKSNHVTVLEMDKVSRAFKRNFVQYRMRDYHFEFENKKLEKDVVNNLSLGLGDLDDNLMTLSMFGEEVITKEIIKESIEEYSQNNRQKLYDAVTLVHKKRVPYEVLEELLSEGVPPLSIYKGIRKHITLVYQAKYLKYNGFLRANDFVEEKKKLFNSTGIEFGNPNIWDEPEFRLNSLLEDADKVTVKDLVSAQTIMEEHVRKNKSVKDGKVVYYEYISKEMLMKMIIELMNRRSL